MGSASALKSDPKSTPAPYPSLSPHATRALHDACQWDSRGEPYIEHAQRLNVCPLTLFFSLPYDVVLN
jgi:hypothetical protein